MKHSERGKTIASNGEIVTKPYGAGRWHSPRTYSCAHPGCDLPASTLVRSGTHSVDPDDDRAHNCCGGHLDETTDEADATAR